MLEFTAPPGTVALPAHTAACLARDAAEDSPPADAPEPALYSGPLRVRYTRLPKGTFAALQPLWAAFQRDVDDIKAALEATLATHSTLTVGDVVHVTHGGARHALVVRELQPADAVSVIETGACDLHAACSPCLTRAGVAAQTWRCTSRCRPRLQQRRLRAGERRRLLQPLPLRQRTLQRTPRSRPRTPQRPPQLPPRRARRQL